MSNLRQAAQQALEACEQRLPLVGQATIIDELNALRAALAQPASEPVAVSERERCAPLLRAAGCVLQAFDDGYLQPDTETLQGSNAVDALRNAWEAFVPAVYRRPQ